MYQPARGRCLVVVWAAVLTTGFVVASNPESSQNTVFNADEMSRRLARELLDTALSKSRPPLTTDEEHARTIDPVLTKGTAVWIHESLPSPPFTVMGGRVFSYRDVFFDPIDAPILKIRAVDDDQVVPFLVRVVIRPSVRPTQEAALTLTFPISPIFNAGVAGLSAWVDSVRTEASIIHSVETASLSIRIPLALSESVNGRYGSVPIIVVVEGELQLGRYRHVPPSHFVNVAGSSIDSSVGALARTEVGRDIANNTEYRRLQSITVGLESRTSSDYERVVAINSWVSTHLSYQESPAARTPIEALQDQSGDCDDYTSVSVALLRTMGIPSRRATGLLYDFDTLAAHTWVEVALPTRNGSFHWFIIDPTLAGTTKVEARKREYVQSRDRILFYPARPLVSGEKLTGSRTIDVLLNWRSPSDPTSSNPLELQRLIDRVAKRVDQEISRGAERLLEAGLTLRRESASIPGSSYMIIDRPAAPESTTKIRLRLENEERLVLDLTTARGLALESDSDLETIDRFRAAYDHLSGFFFTGNTAHSNLELVFVRDRHTDRLLRVSLRFNRYLIEHFLGHILKRLTRESLVTYEEKAWILKVSEASGGRNLYALQEVARGLPATADGANND